MGQSSYVLCNLKIIWEQLSHSCISIRDSGMVLAQVRGCSPWGACAARMVPVGDVDGMPWLGMGREHERSPKDQTLTGSYEMEHGLHQRETCHVCKGKKITHHL